jgi:hypothetical protein
MCYWKRGEILLHKDNMYCQTADSLSSYSGLADPGPIASIFWMDDDLGSEIYLDGIVTLVDAKYISQVRRL